MTNAERQRRYRERKRNAPVTLAGNVTQLVTEEFDDLPRRLRLLTEDLYARRQVSTMARRELLDLLSDV